ncbi:MAG: hypothetical protein HC851_06940 [Acaryochloris sp. RU_4_1]|nr:hypothetical protein [Acaryochloris sp. RU_4_1]NJR54002.1 hypothetical protein [Acaryochloris sp. CRU_2_0]
MPKRKPVFNPSRLKHRQCREQGFALPLAMGLGFVMVILGMSTIMMAQSDRTSSWQRKESNTNLATTEGGMARTLAQLTAPNNAVLLNRNYDTINPKTGKTYLGSDGIVNSGDEESAVVDEWTGYDPSHQPCYQSKGWGAPNVVYSGSIGTGTYTLKAYRYNPTQQQGTLLVEATSNGQTSTVLINIAVKPDLDDFPGIVLIHPIENSEWKAGVLGLRGRSILGSKGNVYYLPQHSADPSLTGSSAPGDTTRSAYLNAIYSSSSQDGATRDTVAGKIFACGLKPWIPPGIMGTNFGVINTSTTLRGVGGSVPTRYRVEQIDLDTNEVLTVDTTGGSVQIDVVDNTHKTNYQAITLRHNAKILNLRTDGKPPQVGDLRILSQGDHLVTLYDQSCIQNAFLWFWKDELRLLTSGPGCPGGQNTNFEGVAWMEAILSSKNSASNRTINYLGLTSDDDTYDNTVTPGATSGIAVPEDVSSLMDLLKYINWPARYKFGGVTKWQRVRL